MIVDSDLVELARLPRAVIFDMDGTLASMTHRERFVQESPKNWSMFHGGMVLDRPIREMVLQARAARRRGDRVIIVTLRPERFSRHTRRWLRDNDVPFDEAYFRPEGNYERGDVVKRDIYDRHIRDRFDVVMSYDDNPTMVDMWSELLGRARVTRASDPGLPPRVGRYAEDPKYPGGGADIGDRPRSASDVGQTRFDDFLTDQLAEGTVWRRGNVPIYVPPHMSVSPAGEPYRVSGYWRRASQNRT